MLSKLFGISKHDSSVIDFDIQLLYSKFIREKSSGSNLTISSSLSKLLILHSIKLALKILFKTSSFDSNNLIVSSSRCKISLFMNLIGTINPFV